MLAALDRLFDGIATLLGWLVALLVIGLLGIASGQVIDRHVWDIPWDAPDQLARIVVVWLTFTGTALALREGAAIRIDLLDHVMPAWMRAARDTLFDLVLLALLVVLAAKGWTVMRIGAMQILLGTPFTADLPYSALFAGSVLGALFIAVRLLRRVAGVSAA